VQLEPDYSEAHEFQLTTRRLTEQISTGVTADAASKQIRFDRFSDVQRPRESLFWQLPGKFTGNQVQHSLVPSHFGLFTVCNKVKTKLNALKCKDLSKLVLHSYNIILYIVASSDVVFKTKLLEEPRGQTIQILVLKKNIISSTNVRN